MLAEYTHLSIVALEPPRRMAPPQTAKFPENSQSRTIGLESNAMMAPPKFSASFSMKVQLRTAREEFAQ
jgi:hypothetical protein